MKLAGLNNLAALKPQANAGAPKSSSAKDPKGSSFDDVLGQTKSAAREERAPISRDERRADDRREAPVAKDLPAQDVKAQSNDVEANGLDGVQIPGAGIPSNISTPVTDRLPNQTLVMGQAANKAVMAPVKGEEGVDSLTRRVVWNDFLRKMKDEFGVSAEDVLGAFGSLSEEDLAKPPGETVDKIVMALGLNDQQSITAKQYFQDLISKTQSRSMGEELSSSGKQINLSLMTERELQRKSMERSLQQMNSNFFMTGPNARPMQAPNMETSAQPLNQKVSSDENSLASLTPDLNAEALSVPSAEALNQAQVPANAAAQAAPQQTAPQPMTAQQRALNELTAQMQPVDGGKEKAVDKLVAKFMQGQAPNAKQASAAAPVGPMTSAATAAAATPTEPSLSAGTLNSMLAALGGDDSASSDEEGGEYSDASYLGATPLDMNSKLNGPINTSSDFQTQLGQVKPGAPMAPADMVQQAQIMVREGGGEMKVTMSPEGLGEVAMRVSVENGKVNVQMITESDEAKKMLEKSLSDLKTQLTHNHLQVADIKVDTASNLGKQMEQQYQDAQRQQAQSQWEQFRQDTGGWKRSPFETPSAREYKGQGQATRDRNAPSIDSVAAASKRNGARRLNLVA